MHTGIKYYRITGPGDNKEPYEPEKALEKAAEHAGELHVQPRAAGRAFARGAGRPPIIVAPYDAELFGHWWFEGVKWLDFLIRKCAYDQDNLEPTTPTEYLAANPRNQVARPRCRARGYKGYNEVWLGPSNDWIYRHLHSAAANMVELANAGSGGDPLKHRALKQAAREILLAQASDWAFIMKTGTAVQYAVRRTRDHLTRFAKLYEDIRQGNIDIEWLNDVESKDNIFPEIDYHVYADGFRTGERQSPSVQ